MDFYSKFSIMQPMKYYEPGGLDHPKAQEMIANKDNLFIAMEKRDGEWSRIIIDEQKVLIQSRSISKITGTYGDKTELVPHIVEELLANYPPGTVLLGELAYEDISKTSRDVGSILRCKVDKAIERQATEKLHLYIFDCLAYDYQDLINLPFSERFNLNYITPKSVLNMRTPFAQYIHTVESVTSDFMQFADRIWGYGAEGIMIIRKDAKYAPGSRKSWDSLKVKKQLGELDVKIIDVIEPKMLYEGSELESWQYFQEGIAVTKPYYYGWKNGVVVEYEGRTIKVSSGLTDEEREWLATPEAFDAIQTGSLYAAITGMELTQDSIRHPVFIDFKNK